MGVNWGNSIANTILFISVYLLSAMVIGIFLSSIVKTTSQLGVMASLIITATSMIGGCWWPIEFSPPIMRKAAMLTPQYWAVTGLKNIVINGLSFSSLYVPILALLAMLTVYMLLSIPKNQFSR